MTIDIAKSVRISKFVLASFLLGSLAAAAAAQPFEVIYGPKDSADRGERRVTPVQICPNQGYVAVGTQSGPAPNPSKVYLVRTDNAGNTMWERTYDVGNDARADEGYALVELTTSGGGFMLTGTSNRGSFNSIFLLKVDCNGLNPASSFYNPASTSGLKVVARDIIQATTGTPSMGTNPGDIVVAGYVESGSTSDAFIMRVRLSFPIIWQRRYNFDVTERLYALTEAQLSGAGTADIIAVGDYITSLVASQGLSMRVNGNNGTIGAGFQCASIFGGDRLEGFRSVAQMKNGNPDIVAVGFSTTPGLRNDVYLVKTRETPCILLGQSTIGNENGESFDEVGFDLKEVLTAPDDSTGAVVGDLALTGYGEQAGSRRDAFLLYADIAQMLPISARFYGDHADKADQGHSLAQNFLNGFVIAGLSDSDFEGNGDPRDLYLINTSNSSKTGCEKDWEPKWDLPSWPRTQVTPVMSSVVTQQTIGTPAVTIKSWFLHCFL